MGEINWDGITDICINSVSDPSKAFIAASYYTSNGGVLAKTVDISYDVMKAIQLKQGDNKYYRFHLLILNRLSSRECFSDHILNQKYLYSLILCSFMSSSRFS